MLEQIFKSVLVMSAMGTIVAFFVLTLKPLTRKIFSANWNYYIWLVVLLVLFLPVRFNFFEIDYSGMGFVKGETQEVQEIFQNVQPTDNDVAVVQEKSDKTEDHAVPVINIIPYIWITGCVLMLLWGVAGYAVFRIRLYKYSHNISCPQLAEYTNRKIIVRESDIITSPLMTGIIKPVLLLPEAEITQPQLNHILAHEIVHFKRCDMMYKWFAFIVRCIHWFNPLMYYINRQINMECEISCDVLVTEGMDNVQRFEYVNTILSLVQAGKKSVPLTTGMAGSKKVLQRRFIMIKKRTKTTALRRVLSVAIAIVILIGTLFASGVLANEILDDNLQIVVSTNGKTLSFTNEPFFENNTLYLPLRETFAKLGVMDYRLSEIKWDNGTVSLCVPQIVKNTVFEGTTVENYRYPLTYYQIRIGEKNVVLSHGKPIEILNVKVAIIMDNAPVLRNNTTYVPFEYIEYMLDKGMGQNSVYNITCSVYGDERESRHYIMPSVKWPLPSSENVTRTFGTRTHPVTGKEETHNGIDIAAKNGAEVIASTSGKVISAGYDASKGNYVKIYDENSTQTLYTHLSSVEVTEGQTVTAGQLIGKAGSTGMSTGPHLHFEVIIDNKNTDPQQYF